MITQTAEIQNEGSDQNILFLKHMFRSYDLVNQKANVQLANNIVTLQVTTWDSPTHQTAQRSTAGRRNTEDHRPPQQTTQRPTTTGGPRPPKAGRGVHGPWRQDRYNLSSKTDTHKPQTQPQQTTQRPDTTGRREAGAPRPTQALSELAYMK